MKHTKEFTEPVFIKAGSNYIKLGLTNQSPRYDCRLITEGNYQLLKKAYDNNAELLEALIETTEFLELLILNGAIKYSKELHTVNLLIKRNKQAIQKATQ